MLKNGSFTEGWKDLPATGNLVNQQPEGWSLRWVEPGQALFGAGDKAGGVPECVHKLADQLPPNEQLGGPDALILAGDATYKIFHASAAFGAELKQTVTGLKPGTQATLTVPVLAVLYGETDPFGAESGVWVNGEGKWVNGGRMGNRKWFRHQVDFTVPDDGTTEIIIRVKSKWPRPKDFFIDGIELEAATDGGDDTEPTDTKADLGIPKPGEDTVRLNVPQGMHVITAASNEPGVVVIVIPQGMNVEIQ